MAKHRIHVIVYDWQGKVLPGMWVWISPERLAWPMGTESKANFNVGVTNSYGEYISAPLDAGNYNITVSSIGGPQTNMQVGLHDNDITVPFRLKFTTPGISLPQPITQPISYNQTGGLTSGRNFWLGLAIGGALLYLLLRR